jgi:RNA polymerase sigma-70 factor (ECF subfamily)
MDLDERYRDLRGLAFGVAYRMLGTVSDAEDVVQEAFLRLQRSPRGTTPIRDPEAYLVTVTTRAAIDSLRAAQVRRQSYIGTWLPEPLLTEEDAAEPAMRNELVSMAVLVLLERLTPVERAVFVLREAFGYGYDEVAALVDRTEDNCRQILLRAKLHVQDDRPRFEATMAERRNLASEFLTACQQGDFEGLVDLLADGVAMHGDGGGKVPAWSDPVLGADPVARTLVAVFQSTLRKGWEVRLAELNQEPGLLVTDASGRPVTGVGLDLDRQVRTIHSVVNPDKLAGLRGLPDLP